VEESRERRIMGDMRKLLLAFLAAAALCGQSTKVYLMSDSERETLAAKYKAYKDAEQAELKAYNSWAVARDEVIQRHAPKPVDSYEFSDDFRVMMPSLKWTTFTVPSGWGSAPTIQR
jgi:hypothetical protein